WHVASSSVVLADPTKPADGEIGMIKCAEPMPVGRHQTRLTACIAFAAVAFHACTVTTDFSPGSDGRLTARPASAPHPPLATTQSAAAGKSDTDPAAAGTRGRD